MAVGVGATMLIVPLTKAVKKIKKNAIRLFTTIGAVADDMPDMYRKTEKETVNSIFTVFNFVIAYILKR